MPGLSKRYSTRNYILNTLPDEEYARLHPDLEEVKLSRGHYIYRPETPIKYVYFPDSAMFSVVTSISSGQSVEAGVIGWEGMAGVEVLMGVTSTNNECMVQIPNGGLRIRSAAIKKEFDRAGTFHQTALQYIHSLLAQVSQTALCNRLHSIEQRLARWLLMSADRAGTDEVNLTQELLALMLGANRPSVTLAAITLQSGGYIKYSRGHIRILDRSGLEDFACECYQTVKKTWPPAPKKPVSPAVSVDGHGR